MNVREALANAATNRLALPADISELPDLAYQTLGSGIVAHEHMQEFIALALAYRQLAWRCADNIGTEIAEAGVDDSAGVARKFLEPTSASMAGISVMTKYLSFLPYVYGGQREGFANKPLTLDEQVQELDGIARRSTRYITDIASQSAPVAGKLEKNSGLREGALWAKPKFRNANHVLEMKSSPEGLYIGGRFDLDGQAKGVTNSWQNDHPGKKLRTVGCMALHLEVEPDVSVFEGIWGQLLDVAVTDERFFAASLRSMLTKPSTVSSSGVQRVTIG